MENEIRKKTKSGLYWNVLIKVPYEIFRFVISIFVARLLEPKDFGIVSVATLAIYYSNSITNFGFNQALVQRKEINDKHINSVFTVDLTISMFLSMLFFFLAPPLSRFFNSPESENVIRVLSFIFVLTTLHDIPYTLLRRDINFKFIAIFDMVKEVFMSVITLILAIVGYKYWSIVWGQLFTLFLGTIIIICRVGWKPKVEYHHPSVMDLFNFGLWSFIRSQLSFFSSRIDRIVIGRALDMTSLGLYDKAKSLYQMPVDSIALNINSVFFSSFSRAQHNKEEVKIFFLKGIVMLSVINFPIYAGLFVLSEHFVIALLGQKWAAMIVPLKVLCISGLFMTFGGLISAFIVSVGRYQEYTLRLIYAAIFLLLMVVLFVSFGITAVAVCVTVYSLLILLLGFSLIKQHIDIEWVEYLACIFPAAISSGMMFLILKYWIINYFYAHTLINLIVMVSIGGLIYALTIVLIPNAFLDGIKLSIFRDGKQIAVKLKGAITPVQNKK